MHNPDYSTDTAQSRVPTLAVTAPLRPHLSSKMRSAFRSWDMIPLVLLSRLFARRENEPTVKSNSNQTSAAENGTGTPPTSSAPRQLSIRYANIIIAQLCLSNVKVPSTNIFLRKKFSFQKKTFCPTTCAKEIVRMQNWVFRKQYCLFRTPLTIVRSTWASPAAMYVQLIIIKNKLIAKKVVRTATNTSTTALPAAAAANDKVWRHL